MTKHYLLANEYHFSKNHYIFFFKRGNTSEQKKMSQSSYFISDLLYKEYVLKSAIQYVITI